MVSLFKDEPVTGGHHEVSEVDAAAAAAAATAATAVVVVIFLLAQGQQGYTEPSRVG